MGNVLIKVEVASKNGTINWKRKVTCRRRIGPVYSSRGPRLVKIFQLDSCAKK